MQICACAQALGHNCSFQALQMHQVKLCKRLVVCKPVSVDMCSATFCCQELSLNQGPSPAGILQGLIHAFTVLITHLQCSRRAGYASKNQCDAVFSVL